VGGVYFDVSTPTTGAVFTKAARSGDADLELALDAAHAAADAWGKTSPASRAAILDKLAAVTRDVRGPAARKLKRGSG